MAIWQYKPMIVPPGGRAVRGSWDDCNWQSLQPLKGFESMLDAFVGETRSWSKEMRIWGEERGDAVVVCYSSGGEVETIGARVDAQKLDLKFVEALCDFASRISARFLDRQEREFAPNQADFLSALESSVAGRFVRDPEGTLRSLPPMDEPTN